MARILFAVPLIYGVFVLVAVFVFEALAMDAENKALCYFYRHPPSASGIEPLSYDAIARLVVKKDKTHPSKGAVFLAVRAFRRDKEVRGRKTGWRKTSAHEDAMIMKAFHKVRPPGAGV